MPKILRFEVFTSSTDQFKEQSLGTTPGLFQGSPATLDFGFFNQASALINIALYSDITLEVWANQENGARLLSKTIAAADFDLTADATTWANKTKQPVRFALTGTELNFAITTGTQATFFMVVGGTPVDGEPETLGYATLTLIKDRFGEPGTVVTEDPASYLTAVQSDARYVREYLVPMAFAGELTDEQAFGYFRARTACRVLGAQLFAQIAPTGSAVTVDLIDGAAAEQTKIATLAAGASYQETLYGAALVLAAGDVIRAKVKSVGSTLHGEFLTCALIIAPAL